MQQPTLIRVTRPDAIKLAHVLERQSAVLGLHADLLREVLDLAHIVASESIPPEVATLNSQLLVEDLDRPVTLALTLALPRDADATCGRISVVSPMGRALLGRAVGDVVAVDLPDGGSRRIMLKSIPYQPEANGIHESA